MVGEEGRIFWKTEMNGVWYLEHKDFDGDELMGLTLFADMTRGRVVEFLDRPRRNRGPCSLLGPCLIRRPNGVVFPPPQALRPFRSAFFLSYFLRYFGEAQGPKNIGSTLRAQGPSPMAQ